MRGLITVGGNSTVTRSQYLVPSEENIHIFNEGELIFERLLSSG